MCDRQNELAGVISVEGTSRRTPPRYKPNFHKMLKTIVIKTNISTSRKTGQGISSFCSSKTQRNRVVADEPTKTAQEAIF